MRRLLVTLFAAATIVPGAAFARECAGTVYGLSGVYNPSTGSGFLAVRAGPTRSATQIGELFNGNPVTIYSRRGGWYQIYAGGIGNGWASTRWIQNSCGY